MNPKMTRITDDARKHVVIVGASFAGLAAARILSKDWQLKTTLIDPRDFFEYVPSNHYGLAGTRKHEKSIAKLAKCIPAGAKFIRAKVTKLGDGSLEYQEVAEDKEWAKSDDDTLVPAGGPPSHTLNFDGLILCTGSSYPGPIRSPVLGLDQRRKEVAQAAKSVDVADSIALLGAGLVGVEFAAEIASKHPDKQVWLLDLAGRVLPTLPVEASRRAAAKLERLGVKLSLGGKSSVKNNQILHPNGEKVKVDLVLRCFGLRPQTGLVSDEKLKGKLGVEVQDDLRVEGYKTPVFAAGDVIDMSRRGVTKTGFMAEELGDLAAKNLAKVLKKGGGTKTVQKLYGTEKAPVVAAVSLGKDCGMIVINNLVLGGTDGPFSRLLLLGKDFLGWSITGTAKRNPFAACISHTGHVATNYMVSAPIIWRLFGKVA